MCTENTPKPAPAPVPDVQTFEDTPSFLAAIAAGMDLCTSDFTGWAVVDEVTDDAIVGTVKEGGRKVRVPASVLLDLRGGHCVRFDRVRATVNDQGWDA